MIRFINRIILISLFLLQCSLEPLKEINLNESIPLETSPDDINMSSITDIKDAYRYLARKSHDYILISGLYFTSNIGDEVINELKSAIDRGVKVKFLLADSPFSRQQFYKLKFHRSKNIEVNFIDISSLGQSKYGQVHCKYTIFDGKYAIIGSANFSYPAFNDNIEINSLIIDKHILYNLEKIFYSDWLFSLKNKLPVKDKDRIYFSIDKKDNPLVLVESAPDEINFPEIPDIQEAIYYLFKKAKHKIDIELYTITSDETHFPFYYDLIADASKRGVKVRLLLSQSTLDKRNESGDYKYTYMHRSVNDLKKLNIKIKKFNIWDMTGTKYSAVHSKLLIVDDKYVMLGSNNWSKSATFENREIAIVSVFTQITKPLGRKFEKDWNSEYAEFLK